MSDSGPLLLLTTRAVSRHQSVYGGMDLSGQFDINSVAELPGWLLGHGLPVKVTLVHHEVSFSHLSTSAGSKWETDGRIESTRDEAPDERTRKMLCNRAQYLKFSPPREIALPAFFSTHEMHAPCIDDVVVQMLATRLIDIPEARAKLRQMETVFRRNNPVLMEDRQRLESNSPFTGMAIAIEFGDELHPIRGVLVLQQLIREQMFRCRLYRSDSSRSLKPGLILRQRARKDLTSISIREKGEIARILEIEKAGRPIEPELPGTGIVQSGTDGAVFPIRCFECNQTFAPQRFTADQLQVIDLWGWLYPLERELAQLKRVQLMYRRHPDARGQVATKFDALLSNIDSESINTPFNELPDPRPADYQTRLNRWTEGDGELKHFLENTRCNVNGRTEFLLKKIRDYESRLRDRCVICPECERGLIGIAGPMDLETTEQEM